MQSHPSRRSDPPRASWAAIVRQTGSEWVDDDATTWAAAVACLALLALAPLLVVAIRVLAAVLGPAAAHHQIQTQAADWIGPSGGDAIEQILARAAARGNGTRATIISLVVFIISAGGVFAQIQQAMNRIWKVRLRSGMALFGFLRARLMSIAVVIIAGIILLAAVPATAWLEHLTQAVGVGWRSTAWIIDVLVSLTVLTLLFALLYTTVPDVDIPWEATWAGAVTTAVLFEIGKFALSAYFKYESPASAFGAVGSLAAVLIWVYYSSMIVFFGAEFTQVFSKSRHFHLRPSKHAQWLSECEEEGGIPVSRPRAAAPAVEPAVYAPQQKKQRTEILSRGMLAATGLAVAGLFVRRRSRLPVPPVCAEPRLRKLELEIDRLDTILRRHTRRETLR